MPRDPIRGAEPGDGTTGETPPDESPGPGPRPPFPGVPPPLIGWLGGTELLVWAGWAVWLVVSVVGVVGRIVVSVWCWLRPGAGGGFGGVACAFPVVLVANVLAVAGL